MSQNPPSLEDFNTQVEALIAQFGAGTFCATEGMSPDYSLFVEEDQVIAEPRTGPRHAYGFFCTVKGGLNESEMGLAMEKWLQSGEAYQEFLAMNVCRYNC